MQEKQNNNLVTISIGFGLILIIAAITFFRTSSTKDTSTPEVVAANAIADNLKKATKISSADLAKKIMSNAAMILIDVRNETDYAHEHILNSKNVPLQDLNSDLAGLARDKTYIVIDYGDSLDMTALATSLFSDAGFKNVYYLDGGIIGWKNGYNSILSEGDPNSFTDQSKVKFIQSDNLKDLITAGASLTIDVRKSDQFAQGHLKNSINIFLDDLEKNKGNIPTGKKIILYDDDGIDAFKGAVRLFDMGFSNTFALSDGLNSWKNKGYEVVK